MILVTVGKTLFLYRIFYQKINFLLKRKRGRFPHFSHIVYIISFQKNIGFDRKSIDIHWNPWFWEGFRFSSYLSVPGISFSPIETYIFLKAYDVYYVEKCGNLLLLRFKRNFIFWSKILYKNNGFL